MKLQDMSVEELKRLSKEARELAKRKQEEQLASVKKELDSLTQRMSELRPAAEKLLSVLGKKKIIFEFTADGVKLRLVGGKDEKEESEE